MKKKYINPSMEIIDVKMEQHLLAGSVPSLGDVYTGGDVLSPEFADIEEPMFVDEIVYFE